MNQLGANPDLTRLSLCQSLGRWLVRNGLQNGKEQQEVFTGLERLSLDSEIVFQKKSTSCLGNKDMSEAFLSPPPLAWDVMGEMQPAQGVQMWHYFTCSTYQKCKGKIPLSPLKLGRPKLIHFSGDPFMEEHS